MKDRIKRTVWITLFMLLAAAMLMTGCGRTGSDGLEELELETTADTHTEELLDEKLSADEEKQRAESEKGETRKGDSKKSTGAFVYVCGAVKTPGVYELSENARVYEAIEAAGGTRDNAAAQSLNQARQIADGERIYIPTLEELEKGIVDGGTPEVTGTDKETGGKININTADKETLMTLPGIGDAKADSIIKYREANGPFKTAVELMNIEGIKEGVFQKIEDKIIVTA